MKDTIETTKVCNKCGEDKPLSEYYKRKGAKDGHRNDCKACVRARANAYHEANRENRLSVMKSYRANNRDDIAAKNRAYYARNRDAILSQYKEYREKNRERILSYQKVYQAENRDQIAVYQKAYHAEKWANDPKYRDRMYASTARRQRLLAAAKQEPYLREDVFERDNWTCQLCQEPIDSELKWPDRHSPSIDHILPVSHGGDDTPANVQAAHLGCNIGKGNRVELEDLQAA